jgi:hypothetical protein
VSLERDFFSKSEVRGGLLGSLAVGLAFLWAVDAVKADAFKAVAVPNWLCRSLLDCY